MIMKKLFKIEVPEKRNFGLDLLRFIAIFTVLVSHSITVLPQKYYFVHKFITDGVLIFFVLSGFLIGRILIRDFKEDISFRKIFNFWKRRWWRTLPAYFFTIIIILVVSFLSQKSINLEYLFKSLIFVQNFTYHSAEFFPESWSLSIEEWFYLILPVILFFIFFISKKTIRKTILIAFIIILLASILIRYYIFYNTEINSIQLWDQNLRSPVITRLDSILIGVLGAWFYHFKRSFFDSKKGILFILGIILFLTNKIFFDYFIVYDFYTCVLYFSIMPLSILLMVPKFYHMKETKLLYFNNVITKGSLISYSMYLINLTIISTLILQPLKISIWFKFILFWFLTSTLSILMYKYVEQPFLKLRDKSV